MLTLKSRYVMRMLIVNNGAQVHVSSVRGGVGHWTIRNVVALQNSRWALSEFVRTVVMSGHAFVQDANN